MKNKMLLAGLTLCGLLFSTNPAIAAGDTGVYVTPKVGAALQTQSDMSARAFGVSQSLGDSDYDWTWALGVAGGYNFYNMYTLPIRAEIEYLYTGEASSVGNAGSIRGSVVSYSQKASTSTLFANAYFDLYTGTIFTPYAGAGFGVSWVMSKGSINAIGTESNTETNLAWNVGLGTAISLNHNLDLDLGYRYVDFGTAQTGLNIAGQYLQSEMTMHQFMVGLRYSF